MADLTLGLDLGSNSLGWALLDEEGGRIVAAGVRVFPEGVDRDTSGAEISKMQQRRIARAMRRQIARRARRKRRLRRALVDAGLLPEAALLPRTDPQRSAWEDSAFRAADPYELRARALTTRLEPYELGRVFLHLAQRRGFKSNRRADRAQRKEQSPMLEEINTLAAELNGRTLGQYLAELRGTDPKCYHEVRLRGRHTQRDMYEHEFDRIWAAQAPHHPTLLTDERHKELKDVIFFQRNLRPPSPALVGRCELEPRLPRCPRADRRAQKFRLYQEVNNLRLIDSSVGVERALTPDERQRVLDLLRRKKDCKFEDLAKLLFPDHPDNIRFNLQRGDRKALKGLPIDVALAGKKFIGKAWHSLSEDVKDRIVASIVHPATPPKPRSNKSDSGPPSPNDRDPEKEHLQVILKEAGLDPDLAPRLLDGVPLEDGYASYSVHAIKRLLPHLEAGLPLTSRDPQTPCALRAAGYLMPWEHVAERRPMLPEPPPVTNPLVRQALHEVRKVVNAVLRELVYRAGHTLARIHIELAREVRGTARERAQRSREMREREAQRKQAAERIREQGVRPTRDAIDRYLLWEEQGGVCIYSGRAISLAQLFGGEVDVDHILPFSRSLDNSLMNRVVAFRAENAAKGDRTPQEWLAADPQKREQVLQRARHLPYPKYRRFLQRDVSLDDFFARQFVDTTYITTQVHQYVRCLGADVVCSKGQHTAELRWQWGLDTILAELPESPANDAAADLPPGQKNRADHRHHAIDAIVIALNGRQRLQQLAALRRAGGTAATGEILPEPWPDFRASVRAAVQTIHVSHRPRRRVSGALHEETLYGPTQTPGEFVVRKPLTALSLSEVERIRDPAIRRLVTARLKQFGLEPGRAKGGRISPEVWAEPLCLPSGVPINRVRIIKKDQTITPIRGGTAWVKPGAVHHVEVFEFRRGPRTLRQGRFVSLLEATQRLRARQPIVQRTWPEHPDARFVMSLCPGDMLLPRWDSSERLLLVSTLVSTQERIHIVDARDARPSSKRCDVGKTPNSLQAIKVTVDPIGRIRRAGD